MAECTLSRDVSDINETWPRGDHQRQVLELLRPGKSPCLVHTASPEETAALAAVLKSQSKSCPVAGILSPPLPKSAEDPRGPPSSVEAVFSGMTPRAKPQDWHDPPDDFEGDASAVPEHGETAPRDLSRVSRQSEWSALVPEEMADVLSPKAKDGLRYLSDVDKISQDATTTVGASSAGGSSSSSGRFATRARQSQAKNYVSIASNLGPKLAYIKAMQLMWNYDLDAARVLLQPWRSISLWHAGAYAECSALRAVLTGTKSEALATLELVKIAETLRSGCSDSTLAHEVFSAEMLLLRSALQVMLGARIRAVYNLRLCWLTYYRLEQMLSDEAAFDFLASDKDAVFTVDDLRGRILFGLGLFYLAVSLLPAGLSSLIRLAGFVMHRQRGKAYLFACVERDLGPRSILAAILLSMYHLDLEPDIARAGNLLVASLGRQPENVLLHWAGSLLAWRNTFIAQAVAMTGKALWCCGEELASKAVYLRYELGMFHFITMDWPASHNHLRCVYESVHSEKVYFPYRTLVTTQLAAVAFSMGQNLQGESLCKECNAVQDWSGFLKIETDFASVLQIFLKRRKSGRLMLAFEVMYFLRQFPKVPAPMLISLKDHISRLAQPMKLRFSAATGLEITLEPEALVEYASQLTVLTVITFYLGDVDAAMEGVPDLAQICPRIPSWASYIAAHGMYWCGRIYALNGQPEEAKVCLRGAKSHKKYPFNIGVKIGKVLAEHEHMMGHGSRF